uniref:FBD domain-containing protein n=1 Tax=Leersia perrieri TaxID=77586 RepID=A0A0D9XEF6_9ORYZ
MTRLAEWLTIRSASLRVLELRLDASAADKVEEGGGYLDNIGLARNLEELRLWGVALEAAPAWGRMDKLRVLEIVGAPLEDTTVKDAIAACPNLTDLSLLGCDCSGAVSIQLALLERCRLDFLGTGNCALSLVAPRVESLEVQGFTWITLGGGHRHRLLSIAKSTGRVYKVDTGKLPDLEYHSMRGVQWSWAALSSCARDVKHLVIKIEFSGRLLQQPPKSSQLDARFCIPCLEEALITVRSPLNAEQKLSTLESLVKYSVRLRSMVIRVSQMKNYHDAADDFFEEICKFKYMNRKKVRVE